MQSMIKVGVLGSVISNICKCEKYLKLWLVLLLSCLRHSENIDRTFFFVCETQNEKATKQTRNIKTSLSFTYPQDSDTWPMLLVTQALSGQVFTDAPMNFLRIFRKRRLDESNKLTELDFREKFLFGDPYLFYRSRAKINILTLH